MTKEGEILINPTSNPACPARRMNCGEDPRTCSYMTGVVIGKKVYDATCTKPVPETVMVEIAGWGDGIQVKGEHLPETIICGYDNPVKGIKRSKGAPSVERE